MISKIVKGAGFAGALSYVMEKDGAQLLHNSCAADSPKGIAREMHVIADMNGRCTKPVLHVSLSSPPPEKLSDEQWRTVAQDYMQKMEINPDTHQHVLVRHTDAEHDHVHLIINRVDVATLAVASDKYDRIRSMQAMREIEAKHGLTKIAESEKGQRAVVKNAVFESVKSSRGDMGRFVQEMDKRGIDVKLNQSKTTGHVSGITYELRDGTGPIKGSELGKSYSYAGLGERLQNSGQIAADRAAAAKEKLAKQAASGLRGLTKTQSKKLGAGCFSSKAMQKKLMAAIPIPPGIGAVIKKAIEM